MIDQNNLEEFVGAKVQVKNLRPYLPKSRGEIVGVPHVNDEYIIVTPVSFEEGEIKQYALNALIFVDKTLQQKATDACEQMQKIKKLKLEQDKKLTIGGKTGRIGKDFHPEYLSFSPSMTMKDIEKKYGVTPVFYNRYKRFIGINVSDSGSSIVLISVLSMEKDTFVYHDRWTSDGYYIHSGVGQSGPQDANFKPNAAVINSKRNGSHIYLFVMPTYQDYIYQGEFELVNWYFETENGADGKPRPEIKFKLKKIRE